ncbi:hypothetical protein pb186bvf_010885 [Paramecium bursaria]
MQFTSSYYKRTQILLKYSQTYTEVDDGIEYFESIYDMRVVNQGLLQYQVI